jgi:glycosyltransferase involved in cell wall biosynthesis
MTLSGRRIAVVLASLELGGAERQAVLLATHLARDHGAEVAVFGMGREGAGAALCRRAGLPCTAVPRVESRFTWLSWLRMRSAMRAIAAFSPAVLIPFTAPANLACTLQRARSGASITLWNQRDEGLGFAPERLVRRGLARAQAVLANGPGSAAYLTARGIPSAAIVHLPNAVELEPPQLSRQAWRARLAADAGSTIVTMIANLSRAKDHRTLLRAWPVVCALGGAPVLALAGRDDGMGGELRALADQLGIAGRVRFLGAIDDVAGLLGASDLGVLSSQSEGCPNAVLEAMAAGLAVVGTDIPGIAALVAAEQLARPGDSAALAAKIIDLLADAPERARQGARNRQRAEHDFSPSAMTSRLVARLLPLLPQRSAP